MTGLVDFVLENGNIRTVLEAIPTQGKALELQERRIREDGHEPIYLDIVKYLRILELLEQNGEMSKKQISRDSNLSKSFKTEIKRYYQSPLSYLTGLGIIEMVGESRRYTRYKLTGVGFKALADYRESRGAPVVGTNFNNGGDWLLPKEGYKKQL